MNNKKSPASNGHKESLSHKAGDAMERAGQKISHAGAEKIGNAVYQAGNKLEHSQDDQQASKKSSVK